MAFLIGQLGGNLMLLFIVLLALRCWRQLELPGFKPQKGRCNCGTERYEPGPLVCVLAAVGVLVAQWLLVWLCWQTLGAARPDFWHHFISRFTTAGDSPHYLFLAQNGYVSQGEHAKLAVFYPLYPLAIRWMHGLLSPFGISWDAAGLAVSQLCWAGAGASMLRLAGLTMNKEKAITATVLMGLYPFGFFALGIYTESLFLLLCLCCMYAAEKGRWLSAGILGFFAALTRIQGMMLLLPVLFLWLQGQKQKKQGIQSIALLLMPAGFGTYLLLNWRLFGNCFEFLRFQREPPWYQTSRWIAQNLTDQWRLALEYPALAPFIYWAQLAIYFIGIFILLWGLKNKAPTQWLIWGGAYQGMCYLSSWLISGSRYMFGCLPLFLLLGGLHTRAARWVWVAISGLALCYFGMFYAQGQAIM